MKKLVASAIGAGMLVAATAMAVPSASASGRSCNTETNRSLGYRTYQYVPSYKGGSTDCLLGMYNSGTAVKSLQRSLKMCYGAKIDVDGKFGPKTREALRKAQRKERIDDDGVYGPESRDNLKMRTYIYDVRGRWVCKSKK